MDVTRDNFVAIFPFIEKSIKECDFIAFDTEFTGLYDRKKVNFFDLPYHRYDAVRKAASTYSIVQLGVSCFKKQSSNQYTCSSFNFFVFRHKTGLKYDFDRDVVLSPSAIAFLLETGFDFNHLFTKGISYCRLDEEDAICKPPEVVHDPIPIPESEKKLIDDVTKKVDSFIEDNRDESLTLEPANGYQRKLIYSVLKDEKYADKITLSLKKAEGALRSLIVTRIDESKKVSERDRLLLQTIGVSKIIDLIKESEKPIVGHNCFIDLAFIVHQFISPLPSSYSEFKCMVHAFFPYVYDTKYLSSTSGICGHIDDSALLKLYHRIKQEPFAPVNVDMISSTGSKDAPAAAADISSTPVGDEKLHQAGYDSYITGYSFIALNDLIGKIHFSGKKSDGLESNLFNTHVTAHCNLLSLSYSFDHTFFNLAGDEPQTDRSNVFHIRFPSAWKTMDLQNLFAPARIRIGWIDDTSAFVATVDQAKPVDQFVNAYTSSSHNGEWKIITYQQYSQSDDGLFLSASQESNADGGGDCPADDSSGIVSDPCISPMRKDCSQESQDDGASDTSKCQVSDSSSYEEKHGCRLQFLQPKRSNDTLDTPSSSSKKIRTSVDFPKDLNW